jgi:hypothetical protein
LRGTNETTPEADTANVIQPLFATLTALLNTFGRIMQLLADTIGGPDTTSRKQARLFWTACFLGWCALVVITASSISAFQAFPFFARVANGFSSLVTLRAGDSFRASGRSSFSTKPDFVALEHWSAYSGRTHFCCGV